MEKSDETLIERTLGILIGVAQHRSSITYTNLSNILGMDMDNPQSRFHLGVILGAVGDRSMHEWGIVLPVLAVGRKDNMPSGRRSLANPSGFYAWCDARGWSISDPRSLVANETYKVYTYFGV